jgi:hypothetical protein
MFLRKYYLALLAFLTQQVLFYHNYDNYATCANQLIFKVQYIVKKIVNNEGAYQFEI